MQTEVQSEIETGELGASARREVIVRNAISSSIEVKQNILKDNAVIQQIKKIAGICVEALRSGNKILFAGNGGSFSDSIHLAAELVSRLKFDHPPLAALALGTSGSNVTAIANDYGYDQVFEKEVLALGNKGDIFFAISTSGNSKCILKAVGAAQKKGLKVFGLTGRSGGELSKLAETLNIPSNDTARIQESHIAIGHAICEIIEVELFRPL